MGDTNDFIRVFNDAKNICRLCLKPGVFAPLNTAKIIGADVLVVDVIKKIVNFVVVDNIKVPNSVCMPCIKEISRIYKFKQKCFINEMHLLMYVLDQKERKGGADPEVVINEVPIEILEEIYSPCEDAKKYSYSVISTCEEEILPELKSSTTDSKENTASPLLAVAYSCCVCNENFTKLEEFQNHIEKSNRHQMFACDSCPMKYGTDELLKQHVEEHSKVAQKIENKSDNPKVEDKPTSKSTKKSVRSSAKRKQTTEAKTLPKRRAIASIDFTCKQCQEEFPTVEQLKEHLHQTKHQGDTLLRCPRCPRKFESKVDLDCHVENHVMDEEFKCEICNLNFNYEFNYKRHMGKHEKEASPFRCKHCKKNFESLDLLKEHQEKEGHIRKKFHECCYCNRVFDFRHKLRKHLVIHSGEKPFKCEICNMTFNFSGNLRRHMKIHTGDRPHVCNVCSRSFIQKTSLVDHLRTHADEKPFICKYCHNAYKQVGQLRQHELKHEINIEKCKRSKRPLPPAGEVDAEMELHECKVCGRLLKSKAVLWSHMKTHGQKRFLCSQCGKDFATCVGLKSHARSHTDLKPFSCNVCSKRFRHASTVKQHMLVHSGEKPYSCSDCSKRFTQKTHLMYHLRTHSGERPYGCHICGKRFALKNNLTVHMRIHTGETPYICDICSKGFYDSSSMKKHRRTHSHCTDS